MSVQSAAPSPFGDLPEGTVTFLFSDVEGSTQLLYRLGDQFTAVLAEHHRILREAVAHGGGQVVRTEGDAFFVAFPRATDAVAAAVEAQRGLAQHPWPEGVEIRVRMGLHTGEPEVALDDYVGIAIHRAARIAHVGSGGQVLLSETTTALVLDELPSGVSLLDLGRHLLKDIRRPEQIYQLQIEGLPTEFPPLKTSETLPPEGARLPRPVGACPYRGLAAFREPDAAFYCGREAFVGQLEQTVRRQTLTAVIVGSSGSGKSSALFAGLLPRLREEGGWQFALLRPGAQPFYALAGALLPLLEPGLGETDHLAETRKLAERLAGKEVSLAEVVERIHEKSPETRQILLVVDQFEELYSLGTDATAQRAFIDELLAAAASRGRRPTPCVILLTLRADFMGQALAYRPFADALREGSVLMGPMTRQELRVAIEKPAQMQGAAFEAGLVERILDDVGDRPGNLPLLEFTLTLLWERQTDGWLSHTHYEEMGSVEGALATYADEVYAELLPEEQASARRALVQLVRPGEGTDDTRRVATREELGEENWRLIQHLADRRLVVTGRDDAGQETAEVVHEALILRWGQFREWMDADRAFRAWQEQLRSHLRQWQESGRDEGALLRGTPLLVAEEWLAERSAELSEAEQQFIRSGVALQEQQAAEREMQRQRELEAARALAAEQERRAEEQAHSARRLRRRALLLAGAMVAAVILAALAFVAFRQADQSAHSAQVASTQAVAGRSAAETAQASEADQRAKAETEGWARATQQAVAEAEASARATQQALAETEASARATQQALAEGQARLATSRELVLATQNNLQTDPERSLLLALQAISLARTTQAEEALRQAVVASRVRLTTEDMAAVVYSIAYSPDGGRLATATLDGTVYVRDAASGEVILTVPGEIGIYSPGGARLATATKDGTVTVRDAASGQELLTLTGRDPYLSDLVFSPDSAYLATASCDGTVRVWDGTTGQEVLTLPVLSGDGGCIGVAFSPGGKHLITGDETAVVTVWDLATGKALLTLPGGTLIAVSPDGKLLVTTAARPSEKLALWDLEASLASGSGQAISSDARHGNIIVQIRFSPDGTRLATGSQDRTAKVWTVSPEGIQESLTLAGHSGTVYDMAFSPDGRFLATGSDDGTARIWDISPAGNQELLTVAGHNNWMRRVAYSPDGARLATTDGHGQAVILDAGTGETLLTFPHPAGAVLEAAFSPDGTRLATAGEDNTARVWDTTNGQELLTFTGHAEAPLVGRIFAGILGVAFSPDGKQVASAGADGQALLWDVETGEILLALQVHPAGIGATRVVFSPDGTLLAAASDEREGGEPLVSVWDLASGEVQYTVTGLPTRAHDLAFSPDGTKLAIGEYGDFLKLYDAASGEEVLSLTGDGGRILAVAFSPDGARLATGGLEPPKLWDLATRQELATFPGHTGLVWGLAFSPDGTRLASASYDGTTRVYAVDVDELVALAQSRLTRWWTPEECQQYLHTEQCPPEP